MNEKIYLETVMRTDVSNEKYKTPIVLVTNFTSSDVITASTDVGGEYPEDIWG